jgi:hypothetical protein
MQTEPLPKSIPNNWTELKTLAGKLKPEEWASIEVETHPIGFAIRPDKSQDILFYQMGNGNQYIPGRDYIYGIKGPVTENTLPKESVIVLERNSGKEISKIAIKPFELIEEVVKSLKSLGKYGPNDILLYFASGVESPVRKSPVSKSTVSKSTVSNSSSQIPPKIPPQIKPVNKEVINKPKNFMEKTAKRDGAVCVILSWPYPASSVQVAGSWTQWKQLLPLHTEKNLLLTRFYLESGVYQYKFLVDGIRWCYDVNKPIRKDPRANINNEIVVVDRTFK